MINKLVIGLLLLLTVGCNTTKGLEPIVLKDVKVEDLVAKPSRELMRIPPAKEKMTKGIPDSDNAGIAARNNLRAGKIESNNYLLQKYVCNLFKEPVGEVCTDK